MSAVTFGVPYNLNLPGDLRVGGTIIAKNVVSGDGASLIWFPTLATLTGTTYVPWDTLRQPVAALTLSGNSNLSPINMTPGGTAMLFVTQGSTGKLSLSFPASVKWSDGIAPSFATGVGKTDVFQFVMDGTYLYGVYSTNY